MMQEKLIGAMILLAASIVFGLKKSREEQEKIRNAEALFSLVENIAEQIEYSMRPLPQILHVYECDALEKSGFLRIAGEEGVEEGWKRCRNKLVLPGREIEKIVERFCGEIGKGYRKEELELCGLTLKRLKAEMERSRSEFANRRKLYHTLPPLLMLSLILILL